MSRGGSSLFGAGALDELAIYNQSLSATTLFSHDHSTDVNLTLVPSFTVTPAQPMTGQNVTFDASGSTDSQGTITDYRWDLDGSGNYATDTGASPTLAHAFNPGTYVIGLQTTDSEGVVARTTQTITVTVAPPSTPVLTLSGATGSTFIAGSTAYTNPQSGNSGGFTVSASTSDSFSGIKNVVFPTLGGFASGGGTDTATPYQTTYAWSGAGATASGPQTVTATNNAGVSASSEFSVVPDTTAPGGGALTVNGTAATAAGSSSYNLTGGFPIATRTDYAEAQSPTQSGLRSSTLTLASASLSGNVCGTFGAPTTITGAPAQSEPTGCYRYTLTGIDNVGNQASVSTTVLVDNSQPTTPSLTFSGLSANTFYKTSTNALYFRPAAGGRVHADGGLDRRGDRHQGIQVQLAVGQRLHVAQTGGKMAYTFGATATQPASAPTLLATSNAGANSANATYSLIADTTGPTGGALTVNSTAATAAGSTSFNTSGSFSIGNAHRLQRRRRLGLRLLDADTRYGDAQQRRLRHLRHRDDDHRQPEPDRAGRRLLPLHADRHRPRRQHLRARRDRRGRQNRADGHAQRAGSRDRPGGGHLQRHRHGLEHRTRRGPAASAGEQHLHAVQRLLQLRSCSSATSVPKAWHRPSPTHRGERQMLRVRVRSVRQGRQHDHLGGGDGQGQHDQTVADRDHRHDAGQQHGQAAGQRRGDAQLQPPDRSRERPRDSDPHLQPSDDRVHDSDDHRRQLGLVEHRRWQRRGSLHQRRRSFGERDRQNDRQRRDGETHDHGGQRPERQVQLRWAGDRERGPEPDDEGSVRQYREHEHLHVHEHQALLGPAARNASPTRFSGMSTQTLTLGAEAPGLPAASAEADRTAGAQGARGHGDVAGDVRDGRGFGDPGGAVPRPLRHQRAHRRILRRVRAVLDLRRVQPEPAGHLGAAARRAWSPPQLPSLRGRAGLRGGRRCWRSPVRSQVRSRT